MSYKIKVIRKDGMTQYMKKVYDTEKKFLKHGKEICRRYHNVTHWNKMETFCELYKMDDEDNYVLIETPKSFKK